MTVPTTPADTARHLRGLAARRRALAATRAERLRGRLPAGAELLRGRYGARRVILFGSLATGACRVDSDVDIAASGVPPEKYFAALADLMEVLGTPVDLVRLEDAPESLRDRIAAEGEAL